MGDIDVDALLAEAGAWLRERSFDDNPWDLLRRLATALRAERARADRNDVKRAENAERLRDEERDAAYLSEELDKLRRLLVDQHWLSNQWNTAVHALSRCERHLRAVLDWMWPEGTTGPACVREARAFLAGEAAPTSTCSFCNGALDDQSFQGLADRVDEVQRLRKDLDAERAAHETTRQLLMAVRDQRDRAEVARTANGSLRAELAAEQEQHGHTRAALAETRKQLKALEAGIAALAAVMKAGRA